MSFDEGLVVRDGKGAIVEAPIVSLRGGAILVDGSGEDPAHDLLSRKRELWESFHPDEAFPGVVVLAVHRDVVWGAIVETASNVLGAGYPHVVFAFHGPRVDLEQPPSSIDRELAAIRARGSFDQLWDLRERVFGGCAGAEPAGELAPGTSLPEHLANTVPPAVMACDCRIELPAVMALLAFSWHSAQTSHGVRVELAAEPGGVEVRLPAGLPWEDAHQKVIDAADRGKLWLASN